MQLNREQTAIIEGALWRLDVPREKRQSGDMVMNILAVAGAGKSYVMAALARRISSSQCLYLTYSRSVADRLRTSLPRNVRIETIGDISRAFVAQTHPAKVKEDKPLPSRLTDGQILKALGYRITTVELRLVRKVLDHFYRSSSARIEESHLDPIRQDPALEGNVTLGTLLSISRDVWRSQQSFAPDTVPVTAAAAVKLWAGAPPSTRVPPSGGSGEWQSIAPLVGANLIAMEEAQDSHEVVLALLARQNVPVLMFGDPMQALAWEAPFRDQSHPLQERGQRYVMSRSYRFGEGVASALSALLDKAGDEQIDTVTGTGISNVRGGEALDAWRLEGRHYAVIARSRWSLFSEALHASEQHRVAGWVDGIESPAYQIATLFDLACLAVASHFEGSGRWHAQISNTWIMRTGSLEAARLALAKRQNANGVASCDWVAQHLTPQLAQIIADWRAHDAKRQEAIRCGQQQVARRDMTMATVPLAKGHEWSRVFVHDDLVPPGILSEWPCVDATTQRQLRWLYTALSRAQVEVAVQDHLLEHFAAHGRLIEPADPSLCDVEADHHAHPMFGRERTLTLELSPAARRFRQPPSTTMPRASGAARQVEQAAKEMSGQSPLDCLAQMKADIARGHTR